MLLPPSSDYKVSGLKSFIPVVLVIFASLNTENKATENKTQDSLWSLEKLETCLSKCQVFEANKYTPAEYSHLLMKSKDFLALPPTHQSYSSVSKSLENSCMNVLLSSSLRYFQEEATNLFNQLQVAEAAYAELLARNNFVQSKQIYNESILIQAELETKQKSFSKDSVWNSDFELFLNELDSLYTKFKKGLELSEKSIQLSLSQSDQLVSAILDVEKTINYFLSSEDNPELLEKLSSYKTALLKTITLIQNGEIKNGYLEAERLRIEIGNLLSQLLLPKFERDSNVLTDKLEKLEKTFKEITPHPEDKDFHVDYIHSKDMLSAIQESLRQAKELSQLERFGEAFELLEEGFQLASLLEEDFPSLKRKQSHIRKKHSQGSSKELQNGIMTDLSSTRETESKVKLPKQKVSVHITRPKDTLSKIAKRYFGKQKYWKKIYKANPKIQNPHLIYPKQRIQLPTIN